MCSFPRRAVRVSERCLRRGFSSSLRLTRVYTSLHTRVYTSSHPGIHHLGYTPPRLYPPWCTSPGLYTLHIHHLGCTPCIYTTWAIPTMVYHTLGYTHHGIPHPGLYGPVYTTWAILTLPHPGYTLHPPAHDRTCTRCYLRARCREERPWALI